MSKARLIITAVIIEGRTQADVARTYGMSQAWVSRLIARYRAEGDAAFEPKSRRPKTSPNSVPTESVELIIRLRQDLTRIVNAITGELLRELTIDPSRDYQPRK